VSENGVLRRIFEPRRKEGTVIKAGRTRWARHEARMRVIRNAYKILVGRAERKRSFGRPRR
jgi:hypothetical protein